MAAVTLEACKARRGHDGSGFCTESIHSLAGIRSSNYEDVRRFIIAGTETFNLTRSHLDSRYVPRDDELKSRFGKFFNLIYVRSNQGGRVVAHFTLYNIISWHIVLAEAGGTPNARIGLISNPLDPGKWSDTIADEIDIDFEWLDSPDYTDEFKRARERFQQTMQHHVESQTAKEVNRIIDNVFKKHGIFDEHESVTDPQIQNKIVAEIAHRLASHALNLPHVEDLRGEEIVARLNAIRDKAN